MIFENTRNTMSGMVFRDPKDLVYAQLERAFDNIPIPRTVRTGNGWFFAHSHVSLYIAKCIRHILSIDGIVIVDFSVPLQAVIFQALRDTAQKSSDSLRVAALQLELSGDGDKMLYDIIEDAIKRLPEAFGKVGRYCKDTTAKKKFISRIIDELFGKKDIAIISAAECFFIVRDARRCHMSLQDQARFVARAYTKKRATRS